MTAPMLARLDELLGEAGIDVLVATSKHALRYLLDGHHHHFFAHMDAIGLSRYLPVLVYPRGRPQDALYVANRNEKDALAVRAQEGRALWPGHILPGASTSIEAMTLARDHISRLGLSNAAIGIEPAFLPADAYQLLKDSTAANRLLDAQVPLERLRAVKTPDELAMLRSASERVVQAMQHVIATNGPGTTKRALEAALREQEVARGLNFEYALITVGSSHNRAPSDEVWKDGDVLSLDSGGNLDGYIGDLCRMGILGEPDAELQDLLGDIDLIQMAARAPIRAGAPGGDIFTAAHAAMAGMTHARLAFVAHGMGLISHEAPRLTATGPVPYPADDATRPLQAGMVISIETTLQHPKRGFIKLEDTVAVTDTGWEGFGDTARGWNRGAS